jgi:hypothetical protein
MVGTTDILLLSTLYRYSKLQNVIRAVADANGVITSPNSKKDRQYDDQKNEDKQ